jgi:hypothetical protein
MVLFFIAITVSFVSSTAFAVQGVADRARLTSPRGGGPSASYKTVQGVADRARLTRQVKAL